MSKGAPGTTIVVPVRHEEGNVGELMRRIDAVFSEAELSESVFGPLDSHVEVIFVDDSDDPLTGNAIRDHDLGPESRLRVQHIYRPKGQRPGGLAGAVIHGLRAARGRKIVTMDADLQHPPETIPAMLRMLSHPTSSHELVVASRYIDGGSNAGLDGIRRKLVSWAATRLTRVLFPHGMYGVTDPMTGFFALHRDSIDIDRFAGAKGFKILMELLVSHPEIKRGEVPLEFERRYAGETKSDEGAGAEFIRQLIRLRIQTLPTFVKFALGGGSIAVLGMAMLAAFIAVGIEPHVAAGIQLAVTFLCNFAYNRNVTWRGKNGSRLRWQMFKFGLTRGTTQALSWFAFVSLMAAGAEYHWFTTPVRAQLVNVVTLVGAMLINYVTDRYVVFRAQSRKRTSRSWLKFCAVVCPLAGVTLLSVIILGVQAAIVVFILAYAIFGLVTSALEVNWRLYGRRTPEARMAMKFPRADQTAFPTRTFSIIVPALREAGVIGETLERLLAQTYVHVQLVVTLVKGDDDTIAVVRRIIEKHALSTSRLKLVVKEYENGSKPQQLNVALERCDGDFVGVIDAETLVAPELVEAVNAILDRDPEVNVVQGGVQLVNVSLPRPASWKRFDNYPYLGHIFAIFFASLWLGVRGWFCIHNCMEYFFWFSSRMAYQVKHGFVPLGGNTVFIERKLLQRAGGWPLNLTEDCALGVELSVLYGAKVATAYEARLASREETPSRMFGKGGFIRQRTRWNQGFLSVMLAGQWAQLSTTRKRSMALYILGMPLIQAFNGVMMPTALVGVLVLTAPVPLVLCMFMPLIPMVMSVAVQVVGAREFSRDFGVKVRLWHYASLILLNPVFQAMQAIPALIAIYRHLRGITNWQKTDHDGGHLTPIAMEAPQHATTSR